MRPSWETIVDRDFHYEWHRRQRLRRERVFEACRVLAEEAETQHNIEDLFNHYYFGEELPR